MMQAGDPTGPIAPRARHDSPFGPLESLDSPEQVRLELELAGPMSRAFAFSVDYGVILIAMALLLLIGVSSLQQLIAWASEVAWLQALFERLMEWISDPEADEGWNVLRGLALVVSLWMLLDLTFTTIYFVSFETLAGGRTPGKRWTQIRVVSENGTAVGWRESLLRNLLRVVDMLPSGYLVGLVAMLLSPRMQRLGDVVAGTLVVRERPSQAAFAEEERPVSPDVEAGFRFTRDELACVGEVERRLIRRSLRRAAELRPRPARAVLERAARALGRRIGRTEPVAGPLQRDFLRALLQASERLA